MSTVGLVYELITVLIDTWWNVNKNQRPIRFVCFRVLIDTWWNVNETLPVREIEHNLVLIDTWWNVNQSSDNRSDAVLAF